MPVISDLEIVKARLPLRFSVGHALATRRETENVCVRIQLDDGSVGYGEGVPRDYVTGDTVDTVAGALRGVADRLRGQSFDSPEDVRLLLDEHAPLTDAEGRHQPVARCAIELALIDAAGHHFNRSAATWLGPSQREKVQYTLVYPFARAKLLALAASATRLARWSQVKLKVGADLDTDLRALSLLRRILGGGADIRVDANCAWTADDALRSIERMRRYEISGVEQPVAAGDHEGLRRVTRETPEAIIVDESLVSLDDAERLIGTQACDAFNIRVSKVGGLFAAWRIAAAAQDANLGIVVGAQVGESGLLSAAGRHLAGAVPRLRHAEGSFGSLLLSQDLTRDRVFPLRGGQAGPFEGPGLGVTVDPKAWRRRTTSLAQSAPVTEEGSRGRR